MPFCTRSSFSLTWSSMLSTCRQKHNTTNTYSTYLWDYQSQKATTIGCYKEIHTVLNILGPPSCALSILIHLLDMALLKPIFPKERFYTGQMQKFSNVTKYTPCNLHCKTMTLNNVINKLFNIRNKNCQHLGS